MLKPFISNTTHSWALISTWPNLLLTPLPPIYANSMVIKTLLLWATPHPYYPTTMCGGSVEPGIKANSQGWPKVNTETEGGHKAETWVCI